MLLVQFQRVQFNPLTAATLPFPTFDVCPPRIPNSPLEAFREVGFDRVPGIQDFKKLYSIVLVIGLVISVITIVKITKSEKVKLNFPSYHKGESVLLTSLVSAPRVRVRVRVSVSARVCVRVTSAQVENRFPGVATATVWTSLLLAINILFGVAVLSGQKHNTPIKIGVWLGSSAMLAAFFLVLGIIFISMVRRPSVDSKQNHIESVASPPVTTELPNDPRVCRPSPFQITQTPNRPPVLNQVTYYKELWALDAETKANVHPRKSPRLSRTHQSDTPRGPDGCGMVDSFNAKIDTYTSEVGKMPLWK